jgi:hypothetical protein
MTTAGADVIRADVIRADVMRADIAIALTEGRIECSSRHAYGSRPPQWRSTARP